MLWWIICILGVASITCLVVAMVRYALGYDVAWLMLGATFIAIFVIWGIFYKFAGAAWYWVLKHPDDIGRIKDWFNN